MKANEAPEKIYITNFDIEALPKDEQLSERWHEVRTQDTDIEYTRTDAFIEKACDAYCKVCGHYAHTTPTYICRQACDYFMKFRKYMKGE